MFERTFLRFTFVINVPYFMLEARNRRAVSNNTAQLVLFWDSRFTTVCSTACMYCFSGYPVRTRFFYLVKVLILGCLSTMKPNTFWSCICNLCNPVFHNIFSIYQWKNLKTSRRLIMHKNTNATSENSWTHFVVMTLTWYCNYYI